MADGLQTTNLDRLKEFNGQEVWIEYVPEYEARRAASRIQGILLGAGWNITKFSVSNRDLDDGVTVWRWFDLNNPSVKRERREIASCEVVNFLHKYKWEATELYTAEPARFGASGPTDVLAIDVGMKPVPYFNDPKLKEIRARAAHAENEYKKDTEASNKLFGIAPKPECE